MSSSHVSVQRRNPRLVSVYRGVAIVVILFLIAYYASILVLLRFSGLPEDPSPSSSNAPSPQLRATEKMLLVEKRTPASQETAPLRDSRGDADALDALKRQISPMPALSSAGNQPIDVVLTGPTQVADGSTFQVAVGVPSGSGVQSANFRLSYDDDALEVLDMTDAIGTTLPVSRSEPGRVELNLDVGRGATQAPAIRFLARTGTSRAVQIAVAVELWDQAGNALPSTAPAPYTIMVDP